MRNPAEHYYLVRMADGHHETIPVDLCGFLPQFPPEEREHHLFVHFERFMDGLPLAASLETY